jgi:hypothetical protein
LSKGVGARACLSLSKAPRHKRTVRFDELSERDVLRQAQDDGRNAQVDADTAVPTDALAIRR